MLARCGPEKNKKNGKSPHQWNNVSRYAIYRISINTESWTRFFHSLFHFFYSNFLLTIYIQFVVKAIKYLSKTEMKEKKTAENSDWSWEETIGNDDSTSAFFSLSSNCSKWGFITKQLKCALFLNRKII